MAQPFLQLENNLHLPNKFLNPTAGKSVESSVHPKNGVIGKWISLIGRHKNIKFSSKFI